MVSAQVLTILVVLPLVAYGYTCHYQDSSMNLAYSECSTNDFCTTITEYNNNNQVTKTMKGCNNGVCSSNGQHNTGKNYDGSWSKIDCCTGNYCNSSTAKGLMAIPVLLVSYFLFK